MILKSFCGVISLQSGVAILASSFMFLSILILMANIGFDLGAIPVGLIFLVIFILLMFVTGVVMFAAAYKESQKLCLVAACLIVLTIVLFVIGSGLSFYNSKSLTEYVCIEERCTESFWLATWRYREYSGSNEEIKVMEAIIRAKTRWHEEIIEDGKRRRLKREHPATPSPEKSSPTIPPPAMMPKSTMKDLQINTTTDDTASEDNNDTTTEYNGTVERESSGYKIAPFIAAIVLFFINLIFLVFSALVVMSYYKIIPYFIKLHNDNYM